MGTDCKSAAFSFGGSNPPAPTKNSGIQWVPEFLFYLSCKRGCKGGFEQQQRRPLPAAETGRSCWGCGQQDARAAQGTMQPLGAATRVPLIHPRPPKNRNVSKYAAVLFYDTFFCYFCFVLTSEQLCKNTVLHNKSGGGQSKGVAIEGGVPGADTVLHKGQLCGGKLLAVQGFVGFEVKPLAQP